MLISNWTTSTDSCSQHDNTYNWKEDAQPQLPSETHFSTPDPATLWTKHQRGMQLCQVSIHSPRLKIHNTYIDTEKASANVDGTQPVYL